MARAYSRRATLREKTMRLSKTIAIGLIAAVGIPAVLAAKDPSPKKIMEMAADCAYVVGVAEGNGVKLNYTSADWLTMTRLMEQNFGFNSDEAMQLARAKRERQARVMGADDAYKSMLRTAQNCDREMAVIQS
jgi:hypothetical protein